MEDVKRWRRELHQIPELGLKEYETAKYLRHELEKMGYSIDKKCIKEDHPLDSLGTHEVTVELHKRVIFKIKIVLKK